MIRTYILWLFSNEDAVLRVKHLGASRLFTPLEQFYSVSVLVSSLFSHREKRLRVRTRYTNSALAILSFSVDSPRAGLLLRGLFVSTLSVKSVQSVTSALGARRSRSSSWVLSFQNSTPTILSSRSTLRIASLPGDASHLRSHFQCNLHEDAVFKAKPLRSHLWSIRSYIAPHEDAVFKAKHRRIGQRNGTRLFSTLTAGFTKKDSSDKFSDPVKQAKRASFETLAEVKKTRLKKGLQFRKGAAERRLRNTEFQKVSLEDLVKEFSDRKESRQQNPFHSALLQQVNTCFSNWKRLEGRQRSNLKVQDKARDSFLKEWAILEQKHTQALCACEPLWKELSLDPTVWTEIPRQAEREKEKEDQASSPVFFQKRSEEREVKERDRETFRFHASSQTVSAVLTDLAPFSMEAENWLKNTKTSLNAARKWAFGRKKWNQQRFDQQEASLKAALGEVREALSKGKP